MFYYLEVYQNMDQDYRRNLSLQNLLFKKGLKIRNDSFNQVEVLDTG